MHRILKLSVIAAVLAATAAAAHADDWREGRGDRGGWREHRGEWREHEHHDGWAYGPRFYYGPPPVYYAPPPRVYYPPPAYVPPPAFSNSAPLGWGWR